MTGLYLRDRGLHVAFPKNVGSSWEAGCKPGHSYKGATMASQQLVRDRQDSNL
jgi:hypothetical protein